MFKMFPKQFRRTLLILAAYVAVIVLTAVTHPGASLLWPLLLIALGVPLFLLTQVMRLAQAHQAMLNRLYLELDAKGFLEEYEPFLGRKLSNTHHLMVRLHLSNAYCALGRFDDAATLLEPMLSNELVFQKEEDRLISRYSVLSNLCYCEEQRGDAEKAKRCLDELEETKAKLEAIQLGKPEKKRMVFNLTLNEQCYRMMTEGKMDVEALRTQVQANNSQQLHRVTTALWIARAELTENRRREAEKTLKRIVEVAPHLYPGQEAQRILDALPGNKRA